MHHKVIRSIALSTLLLNAAYFFPPLFFWSVFLFLIPLFHCFLQHDQLNWNEYIYYGFIWGMLFYSLHLITFIPLLHYHAYGTYKFLFYFLMILYVSIWTALWFVVGYLLSTLFHSKVMGWTISSFCYFYLFSTYAFYPFGCAGGYSFANPVIVLSSLYYYLNWFGRDLLLFFIIVFQMWIAYALANKKNKFIVCSLIMLLLLMVFQPDQSKVISADTSVCMVQGPTNYDSALEAAQLITTLLIEASMQHPDASLFILPESTFPFDLHNHLQVIQMWTDNVLGENKALVIGAYHREKKNHSFNSAYLIEGGRIIFTYDKKLLMPFTEQVPPYIQNNALHKLFLNGKEQFKQGSDTQSSTFSYNSCSAHIAICSEFFLNPTGYRECKLPLAVLVNDNWFMPYMQHLMYLSAYCAAQEYNIPLYYVSNSTQTIIS